MTGAAAGDRAAALLADAGTLAEYARDLALDRQIRQQIRDVLWRVHTALQPPEPEPEAEALREPDPTTLPTLLAQTEALLRLVGDDRGKGARRLAEVRIAKPFRDCIMGPPSARQTEKLATRVQQHFRARMAVTDARLAWFEQRTQQNSPTSVATVKQPAGDTDRLSLELLRKAGKSKFT